MTRAKKKLRSDGYVAVSRDVHASPRLTPPTCVLCEVCWHTRLEREESDVLSPGVTSNVVYFCEEAPRAHGGKVMDAASSVRRRATISGIIQMGAWCL
eukprot:1226456-Pleurochrysis_carterae.AAC.1